LNAESVVEALLSNDAIEAVISWIAWFIFDEKSRAVFRKKHIAIDISTLGFESP
jgi:hypothetical protein